MIAGDTTRANDVGSKNSRVAERADAAPQGDGMGAASCPLRERRSGVTRRSPVRPLPAQFEVYAVVQGQYDGGPSPFKQRG